MKKLVLFLAAVAALVSCTQNDVKNPSESRKVSIVANLDQTKTTLSGNSVMWEAGDAVSLRFTSNSDVYTEVFTTTGSGSSARFDGTLDNEVAVSNGYNTNGYAVYPSTAMSVDGSVEFNLSSEVVPQENGSFASGTNLSSGVVSLAELDEKGSANSTFKNAFSIIRFTLDAGVTSLTVTADEYLTGKATMDFEEDGRLAVKTWVSGSETLVVQPAGDTFTAGKAYNVLVYPGTYKSLSVLLTDSAGCTYEKTITGNFIFEPSEFYTFTFNTQFAKGYWFIGEGYSFTADVDKIMTVYTSSGNVIFEEELTAQQGNRFEGNLPESVVTAENVKGFAVYPSTSYNVSTDKITYSLPSNVDAYTQLAKLYSAYLYVGIERARFTSVAQSLSKLTFQLPANIYSVKVESTTGIVGTANMTVNDSGQLVAGEGNGKVVTLDPNGKEGTYVVYVFSLAGADLTVTYTDGAGKTVVDTPDVPSGDDPLPLPPLSFDREGLFTNEAFTDGGEYEF